MKLSIIVPIYNVEDYIQRCAKSLLDQTCSPNYFEVIFVNDGTNDKSIDKLKEVVDFSRYPNFKLIEKTNGGLSSARNYGINHSHGEYLWFVDSDDWIDSDSIIELLPRLKDIDILELPLHYREEDGICYICSKKEKKGKGRILSQGKFWHPAQFRIYKRILFEKNKLSFKEGVLHEDSQLIPRLLYLADDVDVFDRPVYHYLCRPGSITQHVKEKNVLDLIGNIKDLLEFQRDFVLEEDKFGWGMSSIYPVLNELLQISQRCNSKIAQRETEKFINSHRDFLLYYKRSKGIGLRFLPILSFLCFNNIYLAYKLLYPIRYKFLSKK